MRKLLFVLIISLFAFTACTTTTEPDTTPEAPALEQNFSIQLAGGNLSVDYPADWAVGGEFPDLAITIATSEELAAGTAFDGTVSEGEVYLQVLFSPESSLNPEVDTTTTVLQAIVDSIENPEGTISEAVETTINDKSATYVTLDSAESSDGMFLVIDSGDAYSTIVAAFPDGTLADNQATIEAIAGSIDYTVSATDG